MKLYSPPLLEPRFISLETAERRDLKPLRTPRGSGQTLQFHLHFGAPSSVSVLVRVDATSQRRAEQYAQAWGSRRWYRDQRKVEVFQTEIVD